MNADLLLLSKGGEFGGRSLPAPGARMERAMAEVRRKWQNTDNSASTILKMQNELLGLENSVKQLVTMSPLLLSLSE